MSADYDNGSIRSPSTSLALALNAFIPSVFKSEHGSSPHFDLRHDTIAVRLRLAPLPRPSLKHRPRVRHTSTHGPRLAHRHCRPIRGLAAHNVSPPTSSPHRLALADSQ
ncbi:hypothetical protein F5148DRAFT_1294156 [Russula earlei]|uniref:Uncharacterized protein n=1 Tax=Russula earlei TaxID=71964 RepID=A0ACC0TSN2_9AGAM|nr:hypothetical protein F5148DRAFT_1294156 [Russula earlei]